MKKIYTFVLPFLLLLMPISAFATLEEQKTIKAAEVYNKYNAAVYDYIMHFGARISGDMVMGIILQESTGKVCAKNKVSGATGLGQIKAEEALAEVHRVYPGEYFSDDLCDPINNIKVMVAYLTIIRNLYGDLYDDPEKQATAYFHGPSEGSPARKIIADGTIHKQKYANGVMKWISHLPSNS